MPFLICYDCHDPRYEDLPKDWVYPCEECAAEFVSYHYRETGHHIESRPLEPGVRLLQLFR